MTPLQRLEVKILELHGGLSLRPTLDRVIKIGELLAEAKELLPHGGWLPWVRRVGLSPRTAQLYMQVHDANAKRISLFPDTLTGFLHTIRRAQKEARKADLEAFRSEVATDGNGERAYRVVTADCRRYRWPDGIDVIATDPPWTDREAYRWLARWGAERLKRADYC